MGAGIAIAGVGLAMTLLGVALVTNYCRSGERAAFFGGSLTFWVGGGDALRRPTRAASIWGVILLVLGVLWIIGGLVLASR